MRRRREIDIRVQTAASPEIVFDLLADGSTWPAWSPIESVELERPGSPTREGVGAIRRNRRGRVTGRDELIEVVPPRRFAYRSLSGVPVRDYVGEVDVEPTATGSTQSSGSLKPALIMAISSSGISIRSPKNSPFSLALPS